MTQNTLHGEIRRLMPNESLPKAKKFSPTISANKQRWLTVTGVICLLIILGGQLSLSARRQSQTWDEGNHIFAGYMSWRSADFGLNPEHPPLLKLLATAPLVPVPLKVPEPQDRNFKEEAFLKGKAFLYQNDADSILFVTRMTAATLTVFIALLVFVATREMFGNGAAFVALALLVFEPNLLAHGALVTTDAGFSCFMFATVYAFYRYVNAPSIWRLIIVGLSAGLALAVKHSGILLFPILVLVAACELIRFRIGAKARSEYETGTEMRAHKLAAALVLISIIAVAVLWSFYGFRHQARPNGLQLNPPLVAYLKALKPHASLIVSGMARSHALPESYVYGWADVLFSADFYTSYILGRTYAHGVWFYFPVVFIIKSTLGFLALLLTTFGIIASRRVSCWREIVFLMVPAVFYFLVSMCAGPNIGVRHILPIYVFAAALIGGASWHLIKWRPKWAYLVVALLLLHAASSLRSFPVYIAYSNELWGGPSQTYKYLTDSNVDWAQQLKTTKQYLDQRGAKDCWFAFFAGGVADPGYYGIQCRPLPTTSTMWLNEQIDVPFEIDGPVLISAGNLSGFEFGPGSLNPYEQFQRVRPTAVIDHGVFVFDGHFKMPLAAALSHTQKAQNLLAARELEKALIEAQVAVALASDAVQPHLILGDVLRALARPEEARSAYEKALSLARTIEPDFQARSIQDIEQRLAEQ